MAVNPVRRALDLLAKMGLTVRDDPRKVIDVDSRLWGEIVDGFALSIEQMPQEDRSDPPGLSVVIRNVDAVARTLAVPGWLGFFTIDIDATPTPFGRELLKPERKAERLNVTLGAGVPVDTQVPIGSLFVLKQKGGYRTQVSCTLPSGHVLLSNTISIAV